MGIPPTGKRMSINVIDIIGMANGQGVEHWGVMDQMTMMQQLGLIPDGPPA
jgi:predicted ester cyclase